MSAAPGEVRRYLQGMSDVQTYRERAAEMHKLAERATNPLEREMYLKFAEEWGKLATSRELVNQRSNPAGRRDG